MDYTEESDKWGIDPSTKDANEIEDWGAKRDFYWLGYITRLGIDCSDRNWYEQEVVKLMSKRVSGRTQKRYFTEVSRRRRDLGLDELIEFASGRGRPKNESCDAPELEIDWRGDRLF